MCCIVVTLLSIVITIIFTCMFYYTMWLAVLMTFIWTCRMHGDLLDQHHSWFSVRLKISYILCAAIFAEFLWFIIHNHPLHAWKQQEFTILFGASAVFASIRIWSFFLVLTLERILRRLKNLINNLEITG